MKAKMLMTRNPRTCRPSDSLQTAAMAMWDCDCGFIPVIDDHGHPVGVITDRDICEGLVHAVPAEAAIATLARICAPRKGNAEAAAV